MSTLNQYEQRRCNDTPITGGAGVNKRKRSAESFTEAAKLPYVKETNTSTHWRNKRDASDLCTNPRCTDLNTALAQIAKLSSYPIGPPKCPDNFISNGKNRCWSVINAMEFNYDTAKQLCTDLIPGNGLKAGSATLLDFAEKDAVEDLFKLWYLAKTCKYY